MANPNMSAFSMFSEPLDQTRKSFVSAKTNLSLQQIPSLSQGPVAILWDIENCRVPSDVNPEEVANNIRTALRTQPVIQGAVTLFCAYGDFNAFPRRLREGCQRTGVKLIDVPNGKKDAADKAILIDMFLFALDNRPPSSIMLISGDVDFAPALHVLGQRGYTVIPVIPSGVGVSSALCNAGSFVWSWSSIARGEGLLPPAKTSTPHKNSTDAAFLVRCDNAGYQNKVCDKNDLIWAQPLELNGLKGELVKLLEFSSGHMPLASVPEEYRKRYGKPLCVSKYGETKLGSLLERMADSFTVVEEGKKRSVHPCNSMGGRSTPPVVLEKKKGKEKGVEKGKEKGQEKGQEKGAKKVAKKLAKKVQISGSMKKN